MKTPKLISLTQCAIALLMSALYSAQPYAQTATHNASQSATSAGPSSILSRLKYENAGHVLNELVNSREWDVEVLPGIQSARSDWLEVALQLYPVADAGAGEDLDEALFDALLKAPYKVLPQFRKFWWKPTEVACTFGYDSELKGGVDRYAKKLRAALGNAVPEKFASLRMECLKGIDATLLEVENHKNNPDAV